MLQSLLSELLLYSFLSKLNLLLVYIVNSAVEVSNVLVDVVDAALLVVVEVVGCRSSFSTNLSKYFAANSS